MLLIIGVRFENGNGHEHIVKYKWINSINQQSGISSRIDMINYIRNNPKAVFVEDNQGQVEVFVVDAEAPYLRTKADGRYTNDLLYLTAF